MDNDVLQRAALAFQALTQIEYYIVLGRKMQTREIHLRFLPDNFYHLAGLHKLKNSYPFKSLAHKKVFQQILSGQISFDTIASDAISSQLLPRIQALTEMERILDDEGTAFFQYEQRKTVINSRIVADYVAKGYSHKTIIFTFFLKEKDCFYVDSIFPLSNYDYSLKQTRYTVLLKEKRTRQSAQTTILFQHKNYPIH